MNLDELKTIIGNEGGKIIIVEKGKPVMVIMSFDEYEKKRNPEKNQNSPRMVSFSGSPKGLPKELQGEELKIEDLPI